MDESSREVRSSQGTKFRRFCYALHGSSTAEGFQLAGRDLGVSNSHIRGPFPQTVARQLETVPK